MFHSGSVRKAQVAVVPDIVLCDEHGEKVKLFCTNCNDLVCTGCIVDKHNGHNFKRVKEIVGEKRQELSTKLNNLETIKVPQTRKLLYKTRLKKTQNKTNNKELTDSINNQADKLVSLVNKIRDDLIKEVNGLHKQDNEKLTKLENKLQETLIENEEIIARYRGDLTSSNDVKVVKISLELDKLVDVNQDELNVEVQSVKRHVFIPGNTDRIRDVFGRCTEQREGAKVATSYTRNTQSISNDHVIETKLEVVSEFQHETDKDDIFAITTIDDKSSAWVATYEGTEIKHVDRTGKVQKTLKFTTQISDLAITDDGSLLVAPNWGPDDNIYQIKKVKPNGEIVTFIDTKPLRPHCICTSPTGHLYVGCIDGGNYDVTDKNTRYVIKLSRDGVQVKKWQFDERQRQIFTLPHKLQTNNKDMIWVRDKTARDEGRVVVLHDQEDRVRFIYNGIKNDKIKQDFYPGDLTTAGDGTRMLISDINNEIIHCVDENGVLLYFLGSQYQTGLYRVRAICLNRKDNTLWVGNVKGHVKVLRLK